MTSQERVRAAIARQQPDRVPAFDQPWPETIERWRNEGLPPDQTVGEYFDFDIVQLESSMLGIFTYRTLAPIVLDEHNIEYELFRRTMREERSPARKLFNLFEYVKFRREERAAWYDEVCVARLDVSDSTLDEVVEVLVEVLG